MDGLTEGRIVHFVMPDNEHRPAIVNKVWSKESGIATMTVFLDVNDKEWSATTAVKTETSVNYSETHEPRTWHWIEKA